MNSSLWINICIILGVKVVILVAEIPQDKLRKLEAARIIPDYAEYFQHCVEAEIKFEEKGKDQSTFRILADFGNAIDLRTVSDNKPEIRWQANVGEYYTVALIDPDVVRHPPQPVERMHWLIINVPGCWLPGGQEIIPYQKPANPTKEGEVHKIVALIYQQPDGIMNVTESSLTSDELVAGMRHAFRIRKFAQHYNLMFPFAMNFFLAEYKDPKIPLPGQKRPQQQNQQKKKKNQQQQQNRQQNPNQQIKHNQQKNQNQAQRKHQQNRDQQQLQNKQQQRNKPTTMQVQTEDDQKQIQRQQNKQQPQQPSQKRKQEQEHQQQQQKEQKQQRPQQQKQTPSDLMDTFIAAQKQDFLNQQRQRNMEYQKQQQKQQQQQQQNLQQQHSLRPSTSWPDPPSPTMKTTTATKTKTTTTTTVRTTRHKVTVASSTERDEWAGIMTMQMPIVPDMDEFEDYEGPRTRPGPSTTMHPIRARYLEDYEKKKHRKKHEKAPNGTTEKDEWAGIMTMQMPIVPDMDEFEDYEGPRTRPGPSTTMHPIRARYMQDYEEKRRKKKLGKNSENGQKTNKKQSE